MKKLSFLLLFLFLISAQPFFFTNADYSPGLSLSSGNPGVDQGTPVSLKSQNQEDNIDSMDVHPKNRWTESSNGFSSSISNGLLNMTDVGDNSADWYLIKRELRDISGTIEARMKWNSNGTSNDYRDGFYIRLLGDSGSSDDGMYLYAVPTTAGYCYTSIGLHTHDGTKNKIPSGDERIYVDTWYTIKIDYSTLESEFRIRLIFENGSEVFDYYDYDITASRMKLFSETELNVHFYARSYSQTNYFYVDYIDAPFTEFTWTQVDTPSDSDYLSDSWHSGFIQDDIDDSSGWDLTVPRLDKVSGTMYQDFWEDDANTLSAGGNVNFWFRLLCVDADDGDQHEAVELEISTEDIGGGDIETTIYIETDNTDYYSDGTSRADGTADLTELSFSIKLADDRSRIEASISWLWEGSASDYGNLVFDLDVSDVAADPSQEFVLTTDYDVKFTNNIDVEMGFSAFDVLTRERWKDFSGIVQPDNDEDDAGIFSVIVSPFMWLFTALRDALNGFFEILGNAVDVVATNVSNLISYIQAIAQGVIDALVAGAQDFLDAVFTALGNLIDEMSTWLHAIWDSIPFLVDVGDIVDKTWTQFTSFMSDVPGGLDDIKGYIDFWANWLVIFLTAIALGYPLLSYAKDRNAGTYLREFIDLQLKNVLPISIIGISVHIPFGLVWFPLFLFELGWSG